jgi:hypothetical protein
VLAAQRLLRAGPGRRVAWRRAARDAHSRLIGGTSPGGTSLATDAEFVGPVTVRITGTWRAARRRADTVCARNERARGRARVPAITVVPGPAAARMRAATSPAPGATTSASNATSTTAHSAAIRASRSDRCAARAGSRTWISRSLRAAVLDAKRTA